MKTQRIRQTLTAIAIAASAAASHAGDVRMAVEASELTHENGRAAIYDRIRKVAKSSCPSVREAGSLRHVSLCRQEVTRSLLAEIGDRELTAYVASRSRASDIARG
ncbi:MAG: UrcA family protein [Pseudomonadota bacterium]